MAVAVVVLAKKPGRSLGGLDSIGPLLTNPHRARLLRIVFVVGAQGGKSCRSGARSAGLRARAPERSRALVGPSRPCASAALCVDARHGCVDSRGVSLPSRSPRTRESPSP